VGQISKWYPQGPCWDDYRTVTDLLSTIKLGRVRRSGSVQPQCIRHAVLSQRTLIVNICPGSNPNEPSAARRIHCLRLVRNMNSPQE